MAFSAQLGCQRRAVYVVSYLRPRSCKRLTHINHEHSATVHASTSTLSNIPREERLRHAYTGIIELCKVEVRTERAFRAVVYVLGTATSHPSLYVRLHVQALGTILASHFEEHNFFKPRSMTPKLIR
jgi:hypothetical protein